jgi:hypothetical protein
MNPRITDVVFDDALAERIRERVRDAGVQEMRMFGGLALHAHQVTGVASTLA